MLNFWDLKTWHGGGGFRGVLGDSCKNISFFAVSFIKSFATDTFIFVCVQLVGM